MKTTKRALFSSVMALILCFSMLVGTTFAWFTDEVKSGVNQIVAGNLDVNLYHTDAKVKNEPVTVETKLFDDVEPKLWEPGALAYEILTVANEGTLALKYQLAINFENATVVNGHSLVEALKVAVVDAEKLTSREAAIEAAAGKWQELKSFVLPGELAGVDEDGKIDSKTYGIVIYWEPTDKDNDFNVKGGALSIDLGVNLFATQLQAEIDSFGPDYDEDAVYTNFIVTSEAELVEALANAEDYAVIGIKGNVTWTTGAGIGSTPFIDNATTYSLKPAVKHITLLGLTEDATFTALGSGVGAVGIDGGVVTFKNLKIVDQSVSYAENSWELGYLEFRGNTVFENCDIVNAIMMEGESATFKNCSFNSYDDNQYAVWVANGDASFENCYITGARGIKIHEAYGSEVGSVVIKNNQFMNLTKKPGLAIGDVNADTTVVLQNNTFAGTQAGDQGLYSYETDTNVTTFDFVCADNMVAGYADTNAELKAQMQNNATVILPEGEYTLPSLSGKKNVTIIGAADGSTKIQGVNSYHFGENTTIKNVTFTASGDNSVRYATTSGNVVYENCVFEGKQYGYHVDNANDGTITFNNCTFYGRNAFAASGTYSFNGCTFKYTYSNYNTINIYSEAAFNNCKWDSKLELYIDSGAKAIIDGEETTQRVVFIADARALEAFQLEVNSKKNTYAGKIVMLSADIDLENAAWTPIGQTGATQFQGTFDGHGYTIKNLNVDASKQTGANYSSGLFGWLNNATVKNLTIENATVTGNHNVGVIAGYMETAGCTISNCHVINATVVAKHANNDACGDKVGVIVGHAGNAGVKVENCTAKDSTVTAGRDAGQIAGAALTANVIGCTAENVTVTAGGDCTGANVKNAIIGRVLG